MSFQDEFEKIKEEYFCGEWKKERVALKKQLESRQIVLYGLGFFGGVIVKNFMAEGLKVECFCDSKKRGTDDETNLEIISPQELVEKYSNANIVISVANPSTELEVYNGIVKLGFNEKQIFRFKDAYQFMKKSRVEQVSMSMEEFQEHLAGYEKAYDFFDDEESRKIILETISNYLFNRLFEYDQPDNSYFPDQFSFGEEEVFVDGGLYTGDTTEAFIKKVNGKYNRIIGFDIDKNNLMVAYKNLDSIPRIDIVEKGLWNQTEKRTAELGIMAGSNVKENAEDEVELISLDEFFKDIPQKDYPSFIKLDIEGSEQQALIGAEKIIKECAPKLAICVYHKPEDIYVVPDLLKKMNTNYKFFLKHYSPYIWDTVLYAY